MTTKIKLKKSSVSSQAPGTSDLDYGEVAINYTDGRLYYKNSSNVIKNFIDSDLIKTRIDDAVQVAGGYGDANVIALVDSAYVQQRQFLYNTSSFNTDFALRTTDSLNEGEGNLYYTDSRADTRIALQTGANLDLSSKSTSDLAEGSNLYYTTSRFDNDFSLKTTDSLLEGSDNLYYTDGRVASYLTTNSYATQTYVDNAILTKDNTDEITEGTTNLYYTTARADSAIDARVTSSFINALSGVDADTLGGQNPSYYLDYNNFTNTPAAVSILDSENVRNIFSVTGNLTYDSATGQFGTTGLYTTSDFNTDFSSKTTTNLTEGTNLYYTDARFDTRLATKSTTNLTEGDNLYYTTARADSDAKNAISGSTGITYSNGVISTNDAQIVHDNLSGFVANEHVDHSSVTLTAGTGLSGGGTIAASRTFNVDSAELYAYFNHDAFSGFVSNEHIDHTTITLTAGDGLTGGGDISANRTFAVGAGTGVTVSADAVSIGQSVGTTDNVTFNQVSVKTLAVDSSAAFTLIDYLKRPTYVEGTMWYDEDEHSIAYHTADSDYIHYTGQRGLLRGRNSTGSTILKGTPVYSAGVHISGHPIHGHHPLIYPADASDINKIDVIGIAAQDIANGAHGYVVTRGWLDGLNTASLTTGTPFHLAPGGGYVDNAATYPNYPVQLGFILTQDSIGGNGSIYVDIISHTFDQLRVGGTARIDGNTTIGGNLTVLGTQTVASSENIQIGGAFNYFNAGDTIGETNTAFQGSGLDDATLTGHYTGTATGQTFYVKIDGTGTPDTFEWGYDSASPQATGVSITGSDQALNYGISVVFVATTGHNVGDKWTGSASPVNVDTGWFTNRNTGTSGVGYTHTGMFFDVSTEKFTLISEYDPEPEGTINLADASTTYGTLKAGTFEGNLTGDVTGTVSGNAGSATQLATGRTIALSGDITATGVSFDGTSNISLTTAYTAGSIVNDDINASAAIADTKLATISTAGKVSNSATTATDANTASAIVARDASGNFSAGTITASLTGNVTGNVTGNATTATTASGVAANSVALGTDTTGNYVATVSAGTGIGISGSGSENAAVTVTNNGVTGLTGGAGITASASTGSVTVSITGSELASGVDLDNYRTTGIYPQNTNADAAAGTNYPTPYAGILEVINDDYGNGLHTVQRYSRYNSTQVWTRYYYNGTWQSWRNLSETSSASLASAVTLVIYNSAGTAVKTLYGAGS